MDIKEYIDSGILEAYIFGSTSEAEADELLKLKVKHPQIKDALDELEADLERIAQHMAIAPPPGRWNKIEADLNEIVRYNESDTLKIINAQKKKHDFDKKTDQGEFINLIGPANHIRVHKLWRLLVIGLIALGMIFLCFAIYFSSKNKQSDQQMKELKNNLKINSRK